MTERQHVVDETDLQFIQRRAHEIHLEEAEINDPFISDEERVIRAAKASGLVALEVPISEE